MSRQLFKLVCDDLAARKAGWEEKQRMFYEMRHEGLRRRSKPFPTAADLHYPLIDGTIDKLKPFYFAQIFGQEVCASFAALKTGATEGARAVANWFDWKLKQRSNWFDESLALIDNMCMGGSAPLKIWWDVAAKRLAFDAIDPLFLVLPDGTTDIDTADRVTHIQQLSVAKYRRDKRYAQGKDVEGRIKGRGTTDADSGGKEDVKYTREGLTYGTHDDEIVLWEVYARQDDGRWIVATFAPSAPDVVVRPPFYLPAPYKAPPFVLFPMEIKDKGWAASRGVAEILGPFEAYITRCWNEKADALTFVNRPIFTHDGPAGSNLTNVRIRPGDVVPHNLKRVEMGEPPFSLDEEMLGTRMIAEQRVAMPDFGLTQRGTKDSRTATEVQAATALMTQTTDLRAWIFRSRLGRVYRLAYELLRHFDREDLAFYAQENLQTLDANALEIPYLIEPEGSPDAWNRQARQQRAQARGQMYAQNPFINQAELTKHTLEEDDPRLVRRLFQDPKVKAQTQSEDQAVELAVMAEGFPPVVHPADDDAVHLDVVLGKLEHVAQFGPPLSAMVAQRYHEHTQAHLQQMEGKKDPRAKQYQARAQAVGAAIQAQMQQLLAAQGLAPSPAAAMPAPAESGVAL